jgi:hypothetical protein
MANTPSLNASIRVVRNAGALAGFAAWSVILQILIVDGLSAEVRRSDTDVSRSLAADRDGCRRDYEQRRQREH